MTDKNNDRGGRKENGGGKGVGRERASPVRDKVKKSENTVSFDRPTPQKPSKD